MVKQRFFRLAVCLLALMIALTSVSLAVADGEDGSDSNDSPVTDYDDYEVKTTATITMIGSTERKQLSIETYLVNQSEDEVDVQACDIIFVLDQSKWMNTEDDGGAQREEILESMRELLTLLSTPTKGEHRVAIAGYGRINVGNGIDQSTYNSGTYPGVQQTGTDSEISLNTGYYTKDGFHSTAGWTEVSNINSNDLPTMPSNYLTDESYENVFMSLEEANAVLQPDTMPAWYAGASRMDAGLVLMDELAAIAKKNNEANKDTDGERGLIVCVIASSLPIRHDAYFNQSVIRDGAVLNKFEEFKEENQNAKIFAFGDYHSSGMEIVNGKEDTEETFAATMQTICTESDYYHSISQSSSIAAALNELNAQIVTAVQPTVPFTIRADSFTDLTGDTESVVSCADLKNKYSAITDEQLNQYMADVEVFPFIGYNENGDPTFEENPSGKLEISAKNLFTRENDYISYATHLVPIPQNAPAGKDDYKYTGYKIVITITAPVKITYEWGNGITDLPDDIELPAPEYVVYGKEHMPRTLHTDDSHYAFEGWYLNAEMTQPVEEEITPTKEVTYYGKWQKYHLVNYFLNTELGNDQIQNAPEVTTRVEAGSKLTIYDPRTAYTVEGYSFEGWRDENDNEYDLEALGTDIALDDDLDLYAIWRTKYRIEYYQQTLDGEDYAHVADDDELIYKEPNDEINDITKEYDGFTLKFILYSDDSDKWSTYKLSAITDDDDIKIRTDDNGVEIIVDDESSLVIQAYYNRNTYKVTYDLAGGVGADGADYSEKTALYGAQITTEKAPTRSGYTFKGWSVGNATYNSGAAVTVNGNVTLVARWSKNGGHVGHTSSSSDPSTRKPNPALSAAETEVSEVVAVNPPDTGDTAKPMVWLVLLVVCAAALVVIFLVKKKQNPEQNGSDSSSEQNDPKS